MGLNSYHVWLLGGLLFVAAVFMAFIYVEEINEFYLSSFESMTSGKVSQCAFTSNEFYCEKMQFNGSTGDITFEVRNRGSSKTILKHVYCEEGVQNYDDDAPNSHAVSAGGALEPGHAREVTLNCGVSNVTSFRGELHLWHSTPLFPRNLYYSKAKIYWE